LLPGLGAVLKTLTPALNIFVTTIGQLFKGLLAPLLVSLAKVLDAVFPVLSKALRSLMPPLMSVFRALLPPLTTALNAMLPPVAVALRLFGGELTAVIRAVLPSLAAAIKQLMPPLSQALRELMPQIILTLRTVLPPLVGILKAWVPVLVAELKIYATVTRLLYSAINLVLKPLAAAIRLLIPAIKSVAGVVSKIGNTVSSLTPSHVGHSIEHFIEHPFGLHTGGIVHMAAGGILGGYGGGDKIPAILEPGEGVIRKQSVQTMGSQAFNAINASGMVAGPGGTPDSVYVTAPIELRVGERVLAETVVHVAARKSALA
jgi:phage-related protein